MGKPTVAEEILEKVSRIEAAMFGPAIESAGDDVKIAFSRKELEEISEMVGVALEEMEISHGARSFKMSTVEREASKARLRGRARRRGHLGQS